MSNIAQQILTDWNPSRGVGNVGLANSNRHLSLRLGISSSKGRVNTMGSAADMELRHKDRGNSWCFTLATGTRDVSAADDTSLLLNVGCAQSSLSVLLSTPESLDVMVANDGLRTELHAGNAFETFPNDIAKRPRTVVNNNNDIIENTPGNYYYCFIIVFGAYHRVVVINLQFFVFL